jgi:hypothetical protein
MLHDPGHALEHLDRRSDADYEAAFAADADVRTRGQAIRRGRFLAGTGVPLSDAR